MDLEDTNFEDISPPSLTFDDYICPITAQFFFEPKQAVPCGHFFESDAIEKWMATERRCPCCREEITKTFSVPPNFKKTYTEILEKKPDLHGERYFNKTLFMLAKDNENQFNKYFELFKHSENYCNEIDDDKRSARSSVLAILAESKKGMELICHDEKFREKITAPSLNHANLYGESALYFVTKFSCQLLEEDPTLSAKITEEGLNSIITRNGQEHSALYWLTKSPIGRRLFINNAELRAKIQADAFNHVIQSGPEHGYSPAFQLMKNAEGMELLKNDPVLCAKITAESLNSLIVNGEYRGLTPVYWWMSSENHFNFLIENPSLYKKITAQGLNGIWQVGENKGISPVFWLTKFEKGRELLEKDEKFSEKISSAALNSVVLGGETPGITALAHLVAYDDGLELLKKNAKLRAKITAEGMNSYPILGGDYGVTPAVWFMVSKIGSELLLRDDKLRKKINAEGINTVETGEDNGATGVYWLMRNKTGRNIFYKDARLRELITKESLHRVITTGNHKGKSAAFWLKKYGQRLLKIDETLKNKLAMEEIPSAFFNKNGKQKWVEVKTPLGNFKKK
jgi:hypothetical protein